VDPRIVQAVIAAEAEGGEAAIKSLAARFPGREQEIQEVLAALNSYNEQIRRERGGHALTGSGAALEVGAKLGGFIIVGILGHGAMGVVYRARQASLGNREVALKVLPAELIARDPRFIQRFRREAELASKVHHPNLAEIYGFGPEDDVACFAMRLVEGSNLGRLIAGLALRRRLGEARHTEQGSIRRAVRLMRDIADALSAIHGQGLVHRDVKPANIILERGGEAESTWLGGKPILVDFGLIRPVNGSDLTGSLTLLGTPAYSSPEAQMGRDVDARADVFSSGAVLHDLLSLTCPGERKPAAAGMTPIRSLNPGVDGQLAAVIEKAIEERPSLRYRDAAALRDDLDRWIQRRPVKARPATAFARARLWARRQPRRAIRAALAMAASLCVIVGVSWFGLYVLGLYRDASRSRHLQRSGDLVGAARTLRTLENNGFLTDLLPGLSDDLERAKELLDSESGLLAQPIALLGVNTESATRSALERLRAVALTPRHEDWREPILRFLVRELRVAAPAWRSRMAVEFLSHYLLIHPVACPPTPQSDSIEAELEALILRVTANAVNQPHSNFRQSLLSCTSGLIGTRALAVLGLFFSDSDPEARQIACSGAFRVVEQMQMSGRLREFTVQDWANWANGLWRGATECKRPGGASSRYTRQADAEVTRALIRLAWLRVAQDRGEQISKVVPHLAPEPASAFKEFKAACARHLEDSAEPTEKIRLRRPWSEDDVNANKIRTELWYLDRNDVIYDYENIWNDDPEPVTDGASNPRPDQHAGTALFDFGQRPPKITGSAIRATWTGARVESVHAPHDLNRFPFNLILTRPRRSVISLSCIIPPGSTHARVSLNDYRGYRYLLPALGKARIRIAVRKNRLSVGENPLSVEHDVPLNRKSPLRFEVDPSVLLGRAHLDLTIKLVDATTTCRVHCISVRFDSGSR
jgi:hypothetical protein